MNSTHGLEVGGADYTQKHKYPTDLSCKRGGADYTRWGEDGGGVGGKTGGVWGEDGGGGFTHF